jgi:flagellar biosynthesis protein FlhF
MKMQLARFEAPSMKDALEKIRAAFGEDGMIIGTRTFRRGGVLGVGGQEVVEVFVADTRSRLENIRREHIVRAAGAGEKGTVAAARGSGGPPAYEVISMFGQLREDIQALLERVPEHGGFAHPFLKECYDLLLSRDACPRLADCVVREIANLRLPEGFPDPARVTLLVRSQLAKLFPATPPLEDGARPRIIFLIGPTGVGKTTTIAKLAARAKINEQRKVGLITLDTYRIAAVDQLEKYAEIIGLPLSVASRPAELEAAVRAYRAEGVDFVFVDSAGRSHRDEPKMAELKEFLSVIPEAEVHLVVSGTTQARTIDSVVERFAPLGFHRVILTKIDESGPLGAVAASLIRMGKPVAFITDGQNVPDDIMSGDPERLADLVLNTGIP